MAVHATVEPLYTAQAIFWGGQGGERLELPAFMETEQEASMYFFEFCQQKHKILTTRRLNQRI